MDILLGILVIIEFGIIIFLARKPRQVIPPSEESQRLELLHKYEKELQRTISEEKETSINKIHEQERAAFALIESEKEKKYAELQEKFSELEKQQEESYKKRIEIQEESYKQYLEHQEEIKQLKQNEINQKIEEFQIGYDEKLQESENQIQEIENLINEWKRKYDAAIDVYKQLEKDREAASYYKISFTSEEIEELEELNKAIKKLRNPDPFYKAIYEIYYRNKVNDLVNRVVGTGRVSGIYKITHVESGKCYVGQSVDIGNRWKQHIKRGVGAESRTNNKLYPAMAELGVEAFRFEIVETTEDTSQLNVMEKYWQDFLQAKEFGYSVK